MEKRCCILPIETDEHLAVRALIVEKYVRVQFGRNEFFIPANTFKRAFFGLENGSLKIGEWTNGDPVSFQRTRDSDDGEKMIRFTVRTSAGDIKHSTLPHFVMEEVVERIDQAKALLHSYKGVEETTSPAVALSDESQNVADTGATTPH